MVMEEKFQSQEDLFAAMQEYQKQLDDVNSQLLHQPDDPDALQMKAALLEVLQLSKDLAQLDVPVALLTGLEEKGEAETAGAGVGQDETNLGEGKLSLPGASQALLAEPGNGTDAHGAGEAGLVAGLRQGSGTEGGTSVEAMYNLGKSSSSDLPEQPGTTTEQRRKRKREPDVAEKQHLAKESPGLPNVPAKARMPRGMNPRNRYADEEPDFEKLAGEYPSLRPYVVPSGRGKGRSYIDWTNFDATRELTRALLHSDFGINWWTSDGQLCPPVPNRANYIHWIQDLLELSPPPFKQPDAPILGLDIGTGASCIYPLLGAAICSWHFVATDVTQTAISGATRNLQRNPHLRHLIEIRRSGNAQVLQAVPKDTDGKHRSKRAGQVAEGCSIKDSTPQNEGEVTEGQHEDAREQQVMSSGQVAGGHRLIDTEDEQAEQEKEHQTGVDDPQPDAPVIVGVVKVDERFDFSMCNPPFFASMEEAGANPHTACGGTPAEMVYPGGEEAFIGRIIQDSFVLKTRIHWYSTLVGKKQHLKALTARLREGQVAIVRSTEFVQGRTSRWGLAWSFTPPPKSQLPPPKPTSKLSFSLQGLGRQTSAWQVLQVLATEVRQLGASCHVDQASFSLKGMFSTNNGSTDGRSRVDELSPPMIGPAAPVNQGKRQKGAAEGPSSKGSQEAAVFKAEVIFKAEVFQQAPGALTITASLPAGNASGLPAMQKFTEMFQLAEAALREQFASSRSR